MNLASPFQVQKFPYEEFVVNETPVKYSGLLIYPYSFSFLEDKRKEQEEKETRVKRDTLLYYKNHNLFIVL